MLKTKTLLNAPRVSLHLKYIFICVYIYVCVYIYICMCIYIYIYALFGLFF